MSEEKALVPFTVSTALMLGTDEEITAMANAIALRLPGGNRLSKSETFALATVSIGYGLNPFNGECWYIPGSGPMVGIKGLRKAARKEVKDQGTNYYVNHVLLSQSEKKDLAIPENAIAYRCLLYRTDHMLASAQVVKAYHDAGIKHGLEEYFYRPQEGIGYWVPGEKTKMKPDQAARKRAEAEVLKVAFDVPFGFQVGNGKPAVGIVDPEAGDLDDDSDIIDVDPETGEIINLPAGDESVEEAEPLTREQVEAQKNAELAAAQEAAEMEEEEGEEVATAEPEGDLGSGLPPAVDGLGPARGDVAEIRKKTRERAGWIPDATDGGVLVRVTNVEPINESMAQRLASILGRAVGKDTQAETRFARIQVLQYLFGENIESTKQLTLREGQALLKLIHQPGGAYTLMNDGVREEVREMVRIQSGQDTLPGF